MVKNCLKGELCTFNETELVGPTYPPNIIVNNDTKPYKHIDYPIYCSDIKPSTMPADFIYSSSCVLMVTIVGKSATSGTAVKFEISVEEELDTHTLNLNQFSYTRMLPHQKKSYVLDYHHPSLQTTGLEFVFDGKFGKFDVCIKVDQNQECKRMIDIDTTHEEHTKSYRRLVFEFEKEQNQAKAQYTVEITTGNLFAGFLFGAVEIYDASSAAVVMKEIKAGIPIQEHLVRGNASTFYTFQYHPGSPQQGGLDSIQDIQVFLTPISGSFLITVRNDDTTPTPENAQWKSFSDEITISQDDPLYKVGATYTVGVYPIYQGTMQQEYKYAIKWTYSDKHNMLTPGIPEQGTLTSFTQCFVAEILPSYTSVLFAKGNHADMDMFMSVGKHSHSPDENFNDYHVKADEIGMILNGSQISTHCQDNFRRKAHCNAYLCLSGGRNDRYSVAYSPNNQPFVLTHAKTFHGPIPLKNEIVKFIYYPSLGSPVDIEEYTNNKGIGLSSILINQSAPWKWPAVDDGDGLAQANLIHYTLTEVQKLNKPVVLLSLGRHPRVRPATGPEEFDFRNPFAIEAGFNMKEIVVNSPRNVILERGEWAFFYFYNNEPLNTLHVGLDSLNGGDADMFIAKGKEQRPNYSNYLVRTNGFKSTFMQVPYELVRTRYHSTMEGYYAIAICANSDIHFSLSWGHANGIIMSPGFNTLRTTKIEAGGKTRLVVYNNEKADIELLLNIHHEPVMIYWLSERRELVYKTNDYDSFPHSENYMKKWELSGLKGIQKIVLPESDQNFCVHCKQFFTIENLNTENPIEIQFKLTHAGPNQLPEFLTDSIINFGALKNSESKSYSVSLPASDPTRITEYFVEIQMIHGSGTFSLHRFKGLTTEVAESKTINLQAGYNKFNFLDLGMTSENFTFHRGGYGYMFIPLKGELTCKEACTYKIWLTHPDYTTDLQINHPREALMEIGIKQESFLYVCSGTEKRFDIAFTIEEFTKEGVLHFKDQELKNRLEVYHIKSKDELKESLGTKLKPLYENFDGVNNRLNIEFKPVKGIFVIIVKSSEISGFKYRLEASTKPILTIFPGRISVRHLDSNTTSKVFELFPHQPGNIFVRVGKCFGNVEFQTSESKDPERFFITPVPYNKYSIIWEAGLPGDPLYFKALKMNTNANSRSQDHLFGYLDHTLNETVFSFEAFEARAWGRIPFDQIKPFDQDIFIDLESSTPKVHFRPIVLPNDPFVKYTVRYFVIVSKDSEVVEFYSNCDSAHLTKVLKKGYKIEEAVQIFALQTDLTTFHESTTMKPYHTADLNISSGFKYFLSLYAQVSISHPSDMPQAISSSNLRISYATVEFEYRSFFYPAELLSATLGLIGLIFMSCCVLNRKLMTNLKRKIGGGFRKIGENSDTAAVDQDLEEYFMRIKYEYDRVEKKRSRESSSDVSKMDTSVDENDQARIEETSSDQIEEKEEPKVQTQILGENEIKDNSDEQGKRKSGEDDQKAEVELV